MKVFVFGRQHHLAYDYRVGQAKPGIGPIAYLAILLVALVVGGGVGFMRIGIPDSGVSKVSAQTSSASTNSIAPPKFAPAPLLSPIGDDSALDNIIANFAIASGEFKWSVVVQGVDSNTIGATYNADQSYGSASIYKLLLMYPLSQKLPFSQWSSTYVTVGRRAMSVKDCAQLMLKVSDNACGVALGNWVGWGYGDTYLQELGLSETSLNNSGGPITTASDTAKFLSRLWSSNSFSSDVRQFVLSTLSQQTLRDGIPAGCPDCNVADKTGSLSNLRHDAGIIYAGDKSYILSVFTSGASYAQIAQLTSQIQAYMASLH